MPSPLFHSATLGCKLNQFDTAGLVGELVRRGFLRTEDPAAADVLLVNTCTVTSKADAEARKLVRKLRRSNSHGLLFVTGCYAERAAAELEALPGVDRVFGNREKSGFSALLTELGMQEAAGGRDRISADRGCDAALDLPRELFFGERSRAFLKIQEGCRLQCSYCVIPQVRGASRSVEPEVVVRAADRLHEQGYRETVLTGVNTGDYGRDLNPRIELVDLLDRLLARPVEDRIRLNSLEPLTIGEPLIGRMARQRRIARHLQVPLQSGSDTVLQRMRRNYRTADYAERVERLAREVPGIALGADVIVGFPGETEAEFRETERFLRDSPLCYLHVFSWSPRPGTPAAKYEGRVPADTIRERSARLRDWARVASLRHRSSFVGETLSAVALSEGEPDEPARALTDNFIEVRLPDDHPTPRHIVNVKITEATEEATVGCVSTESDP